MDDLFVRHMQHDLGFDSAPILTKRVTTTRDQRIRELVGLVNRVTGKDGTTLCNEGALQAGEKSCSPSDATNAYDAELVIRERHRMLEKLGQPLPDNFKQTIDIDGLRIIESEEGTAINREGVFSLRVLADGEAFRFVNYTAGYSRNENQEARLTKEQAEALGRDTIAELNLVPAAQRGELTFVKTRYANFTGNVRDPGERVVGTSTYFGRQIGAVPVVSLRGSHVNIEYTANRAVHRISVDWAPIEQNAGATQVPVDAQTFRDRLKGRATAKLIDSGLQHISYEVLQVLCGYVDFGSAYATKELQLGCQVNLRQTDNSAAEVVVIPLGKDMLPEAGWAMPSVIEAHENLARDRGELVDLLGMPDIVAEQSPAATPRAAGCSVSAGSSTLSALWLAGVALAFLVQRRRRPRN